MIRINLLPVRESKKQARQRVQAILLGAAAGAGVLICVGLHVIMTARVADRRTQIQEAQGELNRLAETRKEVDRYRAEEEEINRKLSVIDSLEATRFTNVRVMDEIATRIPERMWLTEMSLDQGELQVKGISIDPEVVAQFLSGLEAAHDFRDVELEETSVGEYQGLKLSNFKIHARYGAPPPAAPGAAPAAGILLPQNVKM